MTVSTFLGVPVLAPPLLPPLVSFGTTVLTPDAGELEEMRRANAPTGNGAPRPGTRREDPWMFGGSFRTIAGSGGVSVAPVCGAFSKPAPGTRSGIVAVSGVVVVAEDTCSAMNFAGDYWARAAEKHAAWWSYAVANEFWTGALSAAQSFGNFHLANPVGAGSTLVDITPSPVTKSIDALARLDGALGTCLKGARGMIHVSLRMLDDLATNNGLRMRGNDFYTPGGTLIVADAGYPGTPPSGTPDATLNTEYLYGTGLVKLYHSSAPVMTPSQDSIAQAMTRHTNDITVRAESSALVVVDPTCLIGIQAQATPE